MPYPKKDEEKKDFLARCMASKHTNDKYPDPKQRYVVCNSLWDMSKDKKKK